MKLAAFATLALLVAAGPASAQEAWPRCEVTGGGFAGNAGNQSTARMRLQAGTACAMVQREQGIRYAVESSPRNGSLATEGPRATYRPNPGFSGSDAFVLRVLPAGGSAQRYFTIVNVEVR